MPINKVTKCMICGATILGLIILESEMLCEECSEKKQKHILENSFAHESLLHNPYSAQLTAVSGTFTSDL